MNSLKHFVRNIGCLFKYDLKALRSLNELAALKVDTIDELLEIYKYELVDKLRSIALPHIKNVEETLEAIYQKKASLCRFGDGEIELINQRDIPFQKASPILAARLQEVLSSHDPRCLIAIPKVIYSGKDNITDLPKKFWRIQGVRFRKTLDKYIDFSTLYYSAELSIAYSLYTHYPLQQYFEQLQRLWRGRDITIICGENVFSAIKHNIFTCANNIEYMYAPSEQAFDKYNELLSQASRTPKDRLVIIILGPTATVLAYDLTQLGFQALDIGHVAKSYDWYIKKWETDNLNSAINFFDAD